MASVKSDSESCFGPWIITKFLILEFQENEFIFVLFSPNC